MSRFFSSSNLDRYRKLSIGSLSDAKQHRLLPALSEEMEAFRREARRDCGRRPALEENIDFQTGHALVLYPGDRS